MGRISASPSARKMRAAGPGQFGQHRLQRAHRKILGLIHVAKSAFVVAAPQGGLDDQAVSLAGRTVYRPTILDPTGIHGRFLLGDLSVYYYCKKKAPGPGPAWPLRRHTVQFYGNRPRRFLQGNLSAPATLAFQLFSFPLLTNHEKQDIIVSTS